MMVAYDLIMIPYSFSSRSHYFCLWS